MADYKIGLGQVKIVSLTDLNDVPTASARMLKYPDHPIEPFEINVADLPPLSFTLTWSVKYHNRRSRRFFLGITKSLTNRERHNISRKRERTRRKLEANHG